MIGFIVTGHGVFASGITSSLKLIMGAQENYIPVDFPEGDTATELAQNIHEAIESLNNCDSIICFCDLLSGSPFNTCIMESMKRDNMEVIFGTNLGMLLECTMQRSMGMEFQALVDTALEAGKMGVGKFVMPTEEDNFDLDDFD